MLSNAYFLAKIRFDTAENEPAKNLQKFAKFWNYFCQFRPINEVVVRALRAPYAENASIRVKVEGRK